MHTTLWNMNYTLKYMKYIENQYVDLLESIHNSFKSLKMLKDALYVLEMYGRLCIFNFFPCLHLCISFRLFCIITDKKIKSQLIFSKIFIVLSL